MNHSSSNHSSFLSELKSWGKHLAFAFVAAFAITNVLIVNAKVPSGSMEKTIMTGDRVVANRLAYLNSSPERFDVVVFRFPDDESLNFVKRVIGLPGEIVEIKGGKVYINNSPLNDVKYINYEGGAPNGDFGPVLVPDNSYFVLGDNRNNSHDSRAWKKNFVEEHKILGEVMFQYFPKIQIIK